MRLREAADWQTTVPMALEATLHIPRSNGFPAWKRSISPSSHGYFVLRENFGVRVAYADEVIEALPATREESELLTIPRRASILSITRIIITTEEIPIEAASSTLSRPLPRLHPHPNHLRLNDRY